MWPPYTTWKFVYKFQVSSGIFSFQKKYFYVVYDREFAYARDNIIKISMHCMKDDLY